MSRAERRDPQEEIVVLLAMQLRLSLGSQAAAISEMAKAGFGTARTAELLGTSANVVNVTLQKRKKTAEAPAKTGPRRGTREAEVDG